jgi:hypothetical protein
MSVTGRSAIGWPGYDGQPIVLRHSFLNEAAIVTRQRLESIGLKVILEGMNWSKRTKFGGIP